MLGAGPGGIALWVALNATRQPSYPSGLYKHKPVEKQLPKSKPEDFSKEAMEMQADFQRRFVEKMAAYEASNVKDKEMERKKAEAFEKALKADADARLKRWGF